MCCFFLFAFLWDLVKIQLAGVPAHGRTAFFLQKKYTKISVFFSRHFVPVLKGVWKSFIGYAPCLTRFLSIW